MLSRQIQCVRRTSVRLVSSGVKSPFKTPKHLDRAATTLQEKYDVLGVENWASKDDLKREFMERVKENHPDRFRGFVHFVFFAYLILQKGENEPKPIDMDIITTAYDDLKAITHVNEEVQVVKNFRFCFLKPS